MTASPHLIEPEINNEILNLLIPSTVSNNEGMATQSRPEFYVEDKIQPQNLKVMEMQIVTADPMASTLLPGTEVESNDIELADEAYQGHSYKKMSIHIGEDAALFLAKIQVQSDQPADSPASIDVSKIKPTFKWKIGLWTRVSQSYRDTWHDLILFTIVKYFFFLCLNSSALCGVMVGHACVMSVAMR